MNLSSSFGPFGGNFPAESFFFLFTARIHSKVSTPATNASGPGPFVFPAEPTQPVKSEGGNWPMRPTTPLAGTSPCLKQSSYSSCFVTVAGHTAAAKSVTQKKAKAESHGMQERAIADASRGAVL